MTEGENEIYFESLNFFLRAFPNHNEFLLHILPVKNHLQTYNLRIIVNTSVAKKIHLCTVRIMKKKRKPTAALIGTGIECV